MVGSTSLPRYRRLYEILRRHINEGVYSEGDLLPSENDLPEAVDLLISKPVTLEQLREAIHQVFVESNDNHRIN